MNEELGKACAQALGWEPIRLPNIGGPVWQKPNGGLSAQPPTPREMEDEIEKRGLQEQYVEALYKLVGAWQFGMSTSEQWQLIRATPEQRARAFLEAVGE